MCSSPFGRSRPDCEKARVAPLRFPARVMLKVAARAECRGVEGLKGVTQCVKGRKTEREVYTEDGMFKGKAEMKGTKREGVEWWSELDHHQSSVANTSINLY